MNWSLDNVSKFSSKNLLLTNRFRVAFDDAESACANQCYLTLGFFVLFKDVSAPASRDTTSGKGDDFDRIFLLAHKQFLCSISTDRSRLKVSCLGSDGLGIKRLFTLENEDDYPKDEATILNWFNVLNSSTWNLQSDMVVSLNQRVMRKFGELLPNCRLVAHDVLTVVINKADGFEDVTDSVHLRLCNKSLFGLVEHRSIKTALTDVVNEVGLVVPGNEIPFQRKLSEQHDLRFVQYPPLKSGVTSCFHTVFSIPGHHTFIHEQIADCRLALVLPLRMCISLRNHIRVIQRILVHHLNNNGQKSSPKSQPNVVGMDSSILSELVDFLESQLYSMSVMCDHSDFTRKSDSKDRRRDMMVPVNMQIYRVTLAEASRLKRPSLSKRKSSERRSLTSGCVINNETPTSYDTITVGCPSPHPLRGLRNSKDFTPMLSLLQLQKQTADMLSFVKFGVSQQMTDLRTTISSSASSDVRFKKNSNRLKVPKSSYGRDRSNTAVGSVDDDRRSPSPSKSPNRMPSETKSFGERLTYDITCLSVALAPIVTGLVNACISNSSDPIFWTMMDIRDHVLFSWSSFLTNCNEELEMLVDFASVVNYLNNNVQFVFTQLNNHSSDPYPQFEWSLSGLIRVTVPLPILGSWPEVMHNIIRPGRVFGCKVLLLNHSIITAPNAASVVFNHDSRLQKKLAIIVRDEMPGEVKPAKEAIFRQNSLDSDRMQQECVAIDQLRNDLIEFIDRNEVTGDSREQPVKTFVDHVHIFHKLSRKIGAIRLTSCKSAKDRSSVACTYEAADVLLSNHPPPNEEGKFSRPPLATDATQLANILREKGVRLKNCHVNVGNAQFKFTQMNFNCLPEEYKPPKCTYCESKDINT